MKSPLEPEFRVVASVEREQRHTQTPASLTLAHPPAAAPGRAPVMRPSDAAATVATPRAATQQPAPDTNGKTGDWLDQVDVELQSDLTGIGSWLDQVDAELQSGLMGTDRQIAKPCDEPTLERTRQATETFAVELANQETDRTTPVEHVRDHAQRPGERQARRSFDTRVKAVEANLGSAEKSVGTLSGSDGALSVLEHKINGLEEQLGRLLTRAAEIQQKPPDLESLSAQQTTFERFMQRVDDFEKRMPALEAKMDAFAAKAAAVGAQSRQAARRVVAMSDGLDEHVACTESPDQDVEKIAAGRLENDMTDDVPAVAVRPQPVVPPTTPTEAVEAQLERFLVQVKAERAASR